MAQRSSAAGRWLSARNGKNAVHSHHTGGWRSIEARLRRFVDHPDPLAMTSNSVAVAIGTHLPFWPLYVLWSAGRSAWPSSLATAALSPVFLIIPSCHAEVAYWGGSQCCWRV